MASAFLGLPGLGIVLDMEKGAIQLDGWECSKILVIDILPHEEITFWTEIMVTSFKQFII